ncbi:hypothetical protein AWB67_05738 [Caballeronia terrestris]|jgi:integrase|uniref:Phage integrase family protein n=2 Tax=Caballeronia TaxID=1827195 RepID=A0A158KIN0_9BURK|nr:hypothetical protein [Caballeronia terrestris]SAL81008.1 hypothetical protein AWB67_05738 [Caballeronia terrestris]
MKRKNHQLDRAPLRHTVSDGEDGDRWIVKAKTDLDFNRWRCRAGTQIDAGRDELILSMAKGLRRLQPILADLSIRAIYWGGVSEWFDFLDSATGSHHPVHCIADIDRHALETFIRWLQRRPARTKSGRLSPATARSLYVGLKTVLMQCVATGELRRDCFARQPFPNAGRAYKSPPPYTKEEMQALLGALASDLRAIRTGSFVGTHADRMLVYFLLVAARTGRNPTSLCEMTRDAVRPHPLKPETHSLLTTYKRRGNSISTLSVRKPNMVEEISVLAADTSTLVSDVLDMTQDLVILAPPELRNCLWLYRRTHQWVRLGPVNAFSKKILYTSIGRFIKRHHLLGDDARAQSDGQVPLALSVMRLRKTFASRVWNLTGGDIAMTANLLGNRPHVTDTHYLAVTPEMVRNHHFLGKCLEVELRGTTKDASTVARLSKEMHVSVDEVERMLAGENNTGVGRCSSPLEGRYAPKDGHTACSAFLHCFRCPNQVVMESDLYRMYSFYWLLVKERNLIGRNQWQKVYGWVIKEIDRVIAPHFSASVMKQAKEKAYADPHPMWRDRSMLLGHNHG